MSKDYVVRPYQPGDDEEIVNLLGLVFNEWPHFDLNCSPLDYWRWKYIDNPLNMKTVVVGLSDNKIIGCVHYFYQKIKIGRELLFCSQGMDVAVHPAFRRLGLYNRMRDENNELRKLYNIALSYWSTGNPILIKRALRNGRPRFIHPVLKMVRINDIDLHLQMMPTEYSWLKKYGYIILKILKRESPTNLSYEFQINEIKKFDDRIDVFWEKVKDHYNFIIERNSEYLNWRYCDARGGDYIVKQAEENGSILGFIVYRINRFRKEYPIGYIVDLLTFPYRLDVAQALINDSKINFDRQGINIIYSWVIKGHPHESLLKKFGFSYSKTNLTIFYRPIDIGNSLNEFKTTSPNHMHLQMGDFDFI